MQKMDCKDKRQCNKSRRQCNRLLSCCLMKVSTCTVPLYYSSTPSIKDYKGIALCYALLAISVFAHSAVCMVHPDLLRQDVPEAGRYNRRCICYRLLSVMFIGRMALSKGLPHPHCSQVVTPSLRMFGEPSTTAHFPFSIMPLSSIVRTKGKRVTAAGKWLSVCYMTNFNSTLQEQSYGCDL